MTIWPPDRNSLQRPVYRSLAASLISAVEAGELSSGDRLPTHRELAFQLGFSVQTVSRAYDELVRRGFVSGEVGRGTFVRAGPSESGTPYHQIARSDDVIDCSILKPVRGDIHSKIMSRALAELAKDPPDETLFSFRPRTSQNAYRASAVKWLAGLGIDTGPDRVLITNGNTAAMTIALMTAAGPGELIVCEELSHHTLTPLTRYLGQRLVGLGFDENGVLPSDFDRACRSSPVKAIYLMPTGLNPMAHGMSEGRRSEICELAREHNVLIIENDAWGPIQPDRPPPLSARAPERGFHFTGFTKCFMPGMRVGYLTVPEAFVSAAATRHLVTNWMVTAMMAEIVSRWIEDGTAAKLLDWQRSALASRNRLAAEVLSEFSFNASPNGLHIWLPLPERWSEDAFVTHARLHGVAIAAGSSFAISDRTHGPGVRVCLGATTEKELREGLSIIARLLKSQPEPALLAF